MKLVFGKPDLQMFGIKLNMIIWVIYTQLNFLGRSSGWKFKLYFLCLFRALRVKVFKCFIHRHYMRSHGHVWITEYDLTTLLHT